MYFWSFFVNNELIILSHLFIDVILSIMKSQYYIILLVCFLLACNKQTKNTDSTDKKVETSLDITAVKSYNYNQLKPR